MGDKAITLDGNPLTQVLVAMGIDPCVFAFEGAITGL